MNLGRSLASLALLSFLSLVAACSDPAPKPDAVAAAPAATGKLNLYIWSEYLPQEVIDEFTQRTGIKVNVDLYDSNEALLEKLQSGVADYDLVFPSDYMVKALTEEKLIQPLDHGRLPLLARHYDPRLLDQKFDPANRYSVPYVWGTTGLGWNKAKITGPVDSWSLVFDPAHKGRILMLDDMREAFAVALKSMGKSLNERDPTVLAQAAAKLKAQKALVKTYNSGDFANILAAGDVDLAHGYNGQIAEVVAAAPDHLAYTMPKEGGTIWLDSVCLTARSRNEVSAYQFLNFVMEPEINARIVNGTHYASANLAAKPFIDPKILADPAIYPADDVINRCEFLEDLGDLTTQLDLYWTEIKAE